MTIVGLVFVIVLTWLIFHFVYAPKAQIKRLWREIFGYAVQINKWKDIEGAWPAVHAMNAKKAVAGNLINALLKYHFSDPEDEDQIAYIEENKYDNY